MENRLEIIVFGATGFTGKYVIAQLCRLRKNNSRTVVWGIAGRNKQKLKDLLLDIEGGVADLSDVPIIIADVTDEESLRKMTARAKIIINCCGPYQLYGEIVVKSCIETNTHLLDISAEPLFIESIEAKYFKAAREKGIYIISSCGLASLPADIGVAFMEKNFEGTLNSVEAYLHGTEEGGISDCPKAHYGTWESHVCNIQNFIKLIFFKMSLQNNKLLPITQPKLRIRYPFSKISIAGKSDKRLVPFPMLDSDVTKRSQRYFYEYEGKRPVQVQCYIMLDSLKAALISAFLLLIGFLLGQFNYGRNLLLQYPELFSSGIFSHKAPTEAELNRMHFSYTFYGEGWSEKSVECKNEYKTPLNKAVIGQVNGVNPGYDFTALSIVLCAVTILTQPKNLPSKGGVYTTAAAFSRTSLVEQFQKNGVDFKIISVKSL